MRKINVKSHIREGNKVRTHNRTIESKKASQGSSNISPLKKETIWDSLMKDKFKVRTTPNRLGISLKEGKKSGVYIHFGFFVSFKVIREDSSAWVVEGEDINRSGGTVGGIWYVNKSNSKKGVFD